MKHLAIAITMILLTGCTSSMSALRARQNPTLNAPPSASTLDSADYGVAPSGDYQREIERAMAQILLDPYSAVFSFNEPERAWLPRYHFDPKGPPPYQSGHVFGWRVHFTVNARNAFGGYAGHELYEAFFQEGQLRAVLQQNRAPDIFGYDQWFVLAYPAR